MNREVLLVNRNKEWALGLLKGAGAVFLTIVSGSMLGIIARAIIARLLGAESFGYYAYALSWELILFTLAQLSLGITSLRFIPLYRSNNQWEYLKGFLQYTYILSGLLSCLISLVTITILLLFRDDMKKGLVQTFLMMSLLLPLDSALMIVSRQVLSFRRPVAAQFPISVLRSVVQLLALAFIWLLPGDILTGPITMLTYTMGTLAALVVTAGFLWHELPPNFSKMASVYEHKIWTRISIPLFLQDILRLVSTRIDLIFVGIFLGTTNAGIYSVASLLSMTIMFGISAINQIVVPRFSELHEKGDKDALQRLVTFASLISTAYGTATLLAIIVVGSNILALFGEPFKQGYISLVILACSLLVNSLAGSAGFLMNMTDHERFHLKLVTIASLVSLGGNLTLVPTLGLAGAASANALSMSVFQIGAVFYIRRHLNINPTIFPFLNR